MNNFWNNIFRYPRFFISSFIGLILVILNPFRKIFKVTKLRSLLFLFILLLFISLYNIIKNMLGF
jgi:hypothetical protein|uniref:Uncharacterized protein ycf33 n=1 Tax=Coscinodiscus wailesii TaxID=671091 RepID=A0A8A6KIJ4_9STRA|nr:hypothetical protein LWB66_pgp028 [Coscinodiscus wailesii]QTI82870.1 hypothetical protein [Coscinodiscus wailesii]